MTIKTSVLGVLSLFVFTGCGFLGSSSDPVVLETIQKAPDFSVTTTDGIVVSSETLLASNKPTIIYFMASRCPSCAKNRPVMNDMYQKYADDINMIAISVDPTDTDEVLVQLANDKGLVFPLVAGNPEVMQLFGAEKQTTTYVLDSQGNIVMEGRGTVFDTVTYEKMITDVLALSTDKIGVIGDDQKIGDDMQDSLNTDLDTDLPDDMGQIPNDGQQNDDLVGSSDAIADPIADTESLVQAPDFTVMTIDGNTVTLDSLIASNKPSIVYFTASRCPRCAKNRPAMNTAYQQYKDNINMIAISIDPTDSLEVIQKLANDNNLSFPMTQGYPEVLIAFGATKQTTTFLLNSKGGIVAQENGKVYTEEEYTTMIKNLLANM